MHIRKCNNEITLFQQIKLLLLIDKTIKISTIYVRVNTSRQNQNKGEKWIPSRFSNDNKNEIVFFLPSH